MKPKETAEHYILSSSPHAHANSSVRRIMLDVIIALLPTTAAGIYFFGMPAVWTILVCVAICITAEALCRIAMKRENTVGDLSAVVTGLLLPVLRVKRLGGNTADDKIAACVAIKTADDVEHRGFATAARAENCNEFAFSELNGNTAQRVYGGIARRIVFDNV